MKRDNYNQLLKDWSRLTKKWGDPEDMTGGFVDQEKFWELLKCPTKAKAANILMAILSYAFQSGPYYLSETNGKVYPSDCPIVKEVYERYFI